MTKPNNPKKMLRVYNGEQKGATAFFRNRPLFLTLCDLLKEQNKPALRVLFHSCSIGAEPYSFAIYSHLTGLAKQSQVELFATDINPAFLQQAQKANYPAALLDGMRPEEKPYFEPAGNGEVRPIESIRNMVSFLPAMSFVDATSEESFDIVIVLNSLTYVSEAEQSTTLRNIAAYNSDFLITSSFHPDTIEDDIKNNGYEPILDNIADIHNAWDERIKTDQVYTRGMPEYSWVIAPFSKIPGYEYRYCSIFRKIAAV